MNHSKQNISKFQNCYGCGVCMNVCPVKIISFHENGEGFYSPEIKEEDKCIDCGLCLKVCAYNHEKVAQENDQPYGYSGKSKDKDILEKCSSGGIGFEIGRNLIEKSYQAVGVRFNISGNRAQHFIATTIDGFIPSMGSKYIQSDPTEAFSRIDRKKKYFVTGTPCQIDSFRRYLRHFKAEDNFVLLDFFCHGMPSLLLWDKYISEIQKKSETVKSVRWRDKSIGWHDSWAINIENQNGTAYKSLFSEGDLFYKFFLGNLCLMRCCYDKCKYKLCSSAADIRIGDLWGKKYESDMTGVSAVLIYTLKGRGIIEELSAGRCEFISEPIETLTEGQMAKSPVRPKLYSYILKAFKTNVPLKRILKTIYFIGDMMFTLRRMGGTVKK